MCIGFGGIVDKKLKLYFSEPDHLGDCSHRLTLQQLGWKDNQDVFNRPFARWQFTDWTEESFEFDEENTLPGWAEENRQEIKDRCVALLKKALPMWKEYQKIQQPALKEYKRIQQPALAEYKRSEHITWEEYKKIVQPALEEYQRIVHPALGEFIKALNQLPEYIGKGF